MLARARDRRAALAAGAIALAAAATSSCQTGDSTYARAMVIESLDQAIGGPKASAREGDVLLENDQIRVVVEQGGSSRLPLGKGGSIVDIDLNRYQEEYRGGRGLDQVGQFAPVANLFLADAHIPVHVQITPSKAGAEVTVAAEGAPILPLLLGLTALLRQDFADDPTGLRLYSEYEVRPGERLLRITTTLGYGIPFCPVTEEDGCNPECRDALYDDDCNCPTIPARCMAGIRTQQADPLPDRPFGGILALLLGDVPEDGAQCQDASQCGPGESCVDVTKELGGQFRVCRKPEDKGAGVLLGDMLIYAADTRAFFRGPGFDTETDIRRLFDANIDTLQHPLHLDAVYAVGRGVSYGYTSPQGSVLVPILSGPFSMGATAGASCRTDQPGCLQNKLVRFQRWLSVGEGDVSSAAEPILRARGAEIGRVSGHVVQSPSGEPVSGAEVYAMVDPRSLPCEGACAQCPVKVEGLDDAQLAALSLEDVLAANRCRTKDSIFLSGQGGLESMAMTDPVGDPVLDGGYSLDLPPGRYVLVVHKGLLRSGLGVVEVKAGATASRSFLMAATARLDYALLDQTGQASPGLVTIGRCLPEGPCGSDDDCGGGTTCQEGRCACARPLPVPLELGGSRQADGVMAAQHARDGVGTFELPPGQYEVVFSRGPGYSIDSQVVTLQSDRTNQVTGEIAKVMDRAGWSTADFHVHASPSLDSDVPLEDRILGMVASDMDFFSSSDHDNITDYSPLVQDMNLRSRLNTQIGVEVSPLDLGHFIGYPLAPRQWQDGTRVLGNGAPDWHGIAPDAIFNDLLGLEGDEGKPIVHVPHPGTYFDAYRVDPITLEPTETLLAIINPLVSPGAFSGNFDAMELFNSKNFDSVRRATVGDVRLYAQGFYQLRDLVRSGAIDGDTYDHRLHLLSTEVTRRRMHRTFDEQEADLAGVGDDLPCTCGATGDCAPGLICDQATMSCTEPPGSGGAPAPDVALCKTARGVVDDWFNMLNRGMVRTGLSGSDVHEQEAGTVRTYLHTGPVTAPNLQSSDVTRAIRHQAAIVSTAPMIHFRVGNAEVGDTLEVGAGQGVDLYVRVEKADWYDIDRVEIYRNGKLIHWVSGCGSERDVPDPDGHKCIDQADEIVAFEETIHDTPAEDSWYVVTTFGLDGRTLAPVYRSVVLSRIGTGEVTQKIFDLVPRLREFRSPRGPSRYPMFPWAITNPIWVDVGGDGWRPPDPPASWCRSSDKGC